MADIEFDLPYFSRENKFYVSFEKELDGSLYFFTVQQNGREDSYILSIGTDSKTQGIRIFAGLDILKSLHHREVPPGELKTLDRDGLNRDPSRDTFGDRITLVYSEVA
jgi:hypothetical protein